MSRPAGLGRAAPGALGGDRRRPGAHYHRWQPHTDRPGSALTEGGRITSLGAAHRAAGGPGGSPASGPAGLDHSAAGNVHDLRGVLRIRPFRRLWIALGVSSLGDWIGLLATTALAAELGRSYAIQSYAIGAVLAVRLIPALVFGPLAGVLADRLDRRWTMVCADVGRCTLYASVPLVRTLWWLVLASLLVECLSLVWIPAKDASVPNLLPPGRLEAANQLSLLTTYGTAPLAALIFSLLSVVNSGLAAGIAFFRTNSVDLALYFDAATFVVSALTVAGIREISRGGAGGRRLAGPEGQSVARSLVEGWRFVARTPLVRGLVAGIVGAFAAAGAVIAVARLFVGTLGAGNAAYGLLFGAVFVGLAAGMFFGPRLLDGLPRRRLFGFSIVAAGVVLTGTALMRDLVLVVTLTTLTGFFAGVAWVVGYTLLGREVPDEVRGRTFAFVQSLIRVDLLLVLAVTPFVAGAVGSHAWQVGRFTVHLDGTSVVLLAAGLLATAVGVLAYRQMDDRRDVSLGADLLAALLGRPAIRGRGTQAGWFVAFEGGEGVGKSTQVDMLARALRDGGREVVVTREPGATAAGDRIRGILLDRELSALTPRAEALLYAADRADHVAQLIRPALERGAVVITDRYVDSSLAYQGAGRQLRVADVAAVSRWATDGLVPDVTVLLDLPADVGLARAGRDDPGGHDRIEAEAVPFHERVRQGFRALAARDPHRYVVLDAQGTPGEVHLRVLRALGTRAGPPPPATAPPPTAASASAPSATAADVAPGAGPAGTADGATRGVAG